jgi:unsaturated rhamnogalacturonyl hydrolase
MVIGGLALANNNTLPNSTAQDWAVRMVDSVIQRNVPFKWHYEYGLMLRAIEQVWLATDQNKYFDHIQNTISPFIDAAGNIKTYSIEEFNLDQIYAGRLLFLMYKKTGDERYKKAAHLLREQLRRQPRTSENGFWHKKIYPYQMWLDGIYMAGPFYTEFGLTFNEPAAFDDVALQITLIEKHTRDTKTGLLYHAWDESKQQRWCNPETGQSAHFWGRAIGWYVLAIEDVLEYLPADYARREELIAILQRAIAAVASVQDSATGLWYQVLDQGSRAGNYLEASASCMYVCAMLKGIRMGYLPSTYLNVAQKAYQGILDTFIKVDDQGLVNLYRTCGGCGLGDRKSVV